MAVLGKMRIEALDFGFATLKGTFLRGTTSFDVFCVKIRARVSSVAFLQEPPPKKKVAESLCAEGRDITLAQNRNP